MSTFHELVRKVAALSSALTVLAVWGTLAPRTADAQAADVATNSSAAQTALLPSARNDREAEYASLARDVEAFGRELEAPAIRGQVQYETALAEHLDLAATPSFVVNGHVQRGWGSYRGLEAVVTRELARAQSVAAEGIPPARVAYEATRRAGPDGERLAAALFEPPDTE